MAQSTNGALTTYAWDWASPVPELLAQSTGSQSTPYLIGHETLGWAEGTTWRYVLPDALGSIRQVADSAGALVQAREWEPYGQEVGGLQEGLGYTGEWQDAAVGLVYLRARWYAPGVGIFTAPDPFPGVQAEPMSLHPYLYVLANPVGRIDPAGLFSAEALKNSLGDDFQESWGLLGFPIPIPFALGRPPYAGLLALLKHAVNGDTLRSGRLRPEGSGLTVEWTQEWTLRCVSVGCKPEIVLTRQRRGLLGFLSGPQTMTLRRFVQMLDRGNNLLGGYVYHQLNQSMPVYRDGGSLIPDVMTLDYSISIPGSDGGAGGGNSVDRYGRIYRAMSGSVSKGIPVNFTKGVVYVGDYYFGLTDVASRRKGTPLAEQIEDFWTQWSVGMSIAGRYGITWLSASKGYGTVFSEGIFNYGIGGAIIYTELVGYDRGWDAIEPMSKGWTWSEASAGGFTDCGCDN